MGDRRRYGRALAMGLWWALAMGLWWALTGCGGGTSTGTTTPATSGATGTIRLQVAWPDLPQPPAASRAIPRQTQSIVLTATVPGWTKTFSTFVNRNYLSASETVVLSSIPADTGTTQVVAKAYRDWSGQGDALAEGSATVAVKTDQVVTVEITLTPYTYGSDQTPHYIRTIGDKSSTQNGQTYPATYTLVSPTSVYVDSNLMLWMVDSSVDPKDSKPMVRRFYPPGYRWETAVPLPAVATAVTGAQGVVYVLLPNNTIGRIDSSGALSTLSKSDWGEVTGIGADPANKFVYATDRRGSRVLKINGDLKGGWSVFCQSPSLQEPKGVAVDKDGNVFVLALYPHVSRYTSKGQSDKARSWDRATRPGGIALDPKGTYVYTTDSDAKIIAKWKASDLSDCWIHWPTELVSATGITVDDDATVFVADKDDNLIKLFAP